MHVDSRRTRGTFASLCLAAAFSPAALAQPQDGYYLHIGNYPVAETNWSNDTQGLAHDNDNWFITQTDVLWKIPVGQDLRTVTATSPGVLRRTLGFYQALAGFEHTGDSVVYEFNGTRYLLVPLEGPGRPATIAIFHCDTLGYLTHFTLPSQVGDAGWCAVNADGVIYSSLQHTFSLTSYTFNWSLFQSSGAIELTPRPSEAMRDEQGLLLDLTTMQGGEFSPNDGLLYLVSGFYSDSNALADREGIHVMEKRTTPQGVIEWRRISHSTRGFGHFDYYYNPGTFTGAEEPEGLTIWDLDDGRAPNIRGQLHATVLTNQLDAGNIDFKHYTSVIRVTPNAGCAPGFPQGAPTCPFPSVAAAAGLAWNESELRISAGSYPGPVTISRRVRLTAEAGLVRIGR